MAKKAFFRFYGMISLLGTRGQQKNESNDKQRQANTNKDKQIRTKTNKERKRGRKERGQSVKAAPTGNARSTTSSESAGAALFTLVRGGLECQAPSLGPVSTGGRFLRQEAALSCKRVESANGAPIRSKGRSESLT